MPDPSDIRRRARLLVLAFLALVVPLGVVLALVVPLGHEPDEPAHLVRAAGLLRGEIIGRRGPAPRQDDSPGVGGLVREDPALAGLMTLPPPFSAQGHPVLTRQMVAAARAVAWTGVLAPLDLHSIAGYFPLFYVPASIAIGAARLAGASPYDAFIAARLANLLAFALLGTASLLLARRGAALLFCLFALPMTVALAASANQDGLLIAGAGFACAMLTRAEAQGGAISRSGWFRGAAALIACVAAVKPPYLLLATLLVPPLAWRDGEGRDLRRRIAAMLLACLPALVWAWWVQDLARLPHEFPSYDAGPLWPGPRPATFDASDAGAQALVLMAAPWRLVTLAWATFVPAAVPLAAQAIGVLGWLSVVLPRWLYIAWLFALAAAALADTWGDPPDPPGRQWLETPLLLADAALGVVSILDAAYLTWTMVGAAAIEGMQGRYLLPLLPLLARAVPLLRAGRRLRWLGLAPLSVAALDVAVVPRVVIDWFYLS